MTFRKTALVSAIALSLVPALAGAQQAADAPPQAKPGECYARVLVPAVTKTAAEEVVKREASSRIEIIPAKYETVQEQVLVKEASKRLEIVPATYKFAEEQVLVRPASKRLVEIPAVYETVSEQVIDQPARTMWKRGKYPNATSTRVDEGTGDIMCLVEVPATYKTVTRTVVKQPASTREVEIPAQYATVRKQVIDQAPTTREVEIPAVYKTVAINRQVSPPAENKIDIPAQTQLVSRTEVVSPERVEWKQILCDANMTRDKVSQVQAALQKEGFYRGPIDGAIGTVTANAVAAFNQSKGIARDGFLTFDTLKALGI